jgi:uncharacterized protein YggU (UPF0235/DUF167 family)
VIELEAHARGFVLPVKATAGARSDAVRGEQDGALKVSVVQVPEKGKANRALVRTLAGALGVRRSQVELLSGATHPTKRFLVTGVTQADLEKRIRQLV